MLQMPFSRTMAAVARNGKAASGEDRLFIAVERVGDRPRMIRMTGEAFWRYGP